MRDYKWFQWWCLNPQSCRVAATLHIIIDLSPRWYHFSRVCIHGRAHTYANVRTQNNTRSYMCAHTPGLIMKFHSSPVWKFFLIKFHLLQLGFHHPITGRRAEALMHAWFQQALGEYQSMPPILFYFSPSISYFSPRSPVLTRTPHRISPLTRTFLFLWISSSPCSSCSHSLPTIAVSCKTHWELWEDEPTPSASDDHNDRNNSTFVRDTKQCNRWCLSVSLQRTGQQHISFSHFFYRHVL